MPNKTRKNGGARHHSSRKSHRSSVHRVPGQVVTSSYRKSYKRNMNAKAAAAEPSATARRAASRSRQRNVAQGAMNATASAASAAPTVSFTAHSRSWHKGPIRHILPHQEAMTNARSKKILAKAKANHKKAEASAKKAAQAASANELANMFGSMGVENKKNNA